GEYYLPLPYGADVFRLALPGFRDGAEYALPYAESGMEGTIYLVEGRWVLKDNADGGEYYLPLPYGADVFRLALPGFRDGAEYALPYAESGMEGTIYLVEGRWVLKDNADGGEYYLPLPYGADVFRLALPGFRDGAEYALPYAESGMEGTIYLVDGRWVLKDNADGGVYYLPIPYGVDVFRLAFPGFRDVVEFALPYAESGMEGTVYLVDGRWVLRDGADGEEYFVTFSPALDMALFPPKPRATPVDTNANSGLSGLIYLLTGESQFVDRSDVNLGAYMPYPFEDTFANMVLADDKSAVRDIYETILRIETTPNRPSEIIIDIGSIREEHGISTLELLPKSVFSNESERKAYLLMIKHLSNGKYYLQIGLFDRTDVLALELANLDWAYPYALETSGTPQSPTYKLLVGPLNEGESNALLLHFRRYGYYDAFIRNDG
ncbi:MAG: SPOR domain-containing protein, partial [Spirochaetaceae bacterium]|nr:SPOR domain-containing protein [Spirochaetaceae bacterium]